MLLHLRHKLAESSNEAESAATTAEKQAAQSYAWLMSNPSALSALRKVGRIAQKPFVSDEKISRRVSLPLVSKWTAARDLPSLPNRTFKEIWARQLENEAESSP